MIKKILIAVGAFVLIAVVGIGVYLYILSRDGETLDAESKQYADTAVRAVIANWDVKELEMRASPELKSSGGDSGLAKMMEVTKRLGGLKKFEGVKGEANIHVSPDRGKVITAEYIGRAIFERGPADIRIKLVKRAKDWQILGFNVKSEALLNPVPSAQEKSGQAPLDAAKPPDAPKPEAQVAAVMPTSPPASAPAAKAAAAPVMKAEVVAKPATKAEPAPAADKPKPARRAVKRKPEPAVVTQAPPAPPAKTPKYNDVMTAVVYRDQAGARELLELGWWVDRPDSQGATPLMAAARSGDAAMVQLLLKSGANPNSSAAGGSVLDHARKGEDAKIVEMLRRAGAR